MLVKIAEKDFQEFILLIESKIKSIQSSKDGEAALQALRLIKSKAVEFTTVNSDETEETQQPLSETETSSVQESYSAEIEEHHQAEEPSQGTTSTATVQRRRKRVNRKISKVCIFHYMAWQTSLLFSVFSQAHFIMHISRHFNFP